MTATPSPESLAELRELHTLTPWRELQSMAEIGTGVDVILSNKTVTDISDRLDISEPVWREYLDEHEELNQLEKAVINRQLGEITLLRYAVGQQTGEYDNSDLIRRSMESLYDYYNPDLYRAALRQKLEKIVSLNIPADLEYSRALLIDRFQPYLGGDKSQEYTLVQPREETLLQIAKWLHGQFEDLFEEIDHGSKKKFDASDIAQLFQLAVDTTPVLRENGWTVEVLERGKNAISVHAADKKILISSQRVATPSSLKRLIVHEVFGHAIRSGIAEDKKIEVGQQGTAGYARFEESFMIALEQCLEGKYNPNRGIDHYLAVGLSVTEGLSKDEIARLFEVIHTLEKVGDELTDTVISNARIATKSQIQRTFAGMTDIDDGIAYRKDIDYLHGLNDSWRLLNFICDCHIVEEAMPWLLVAKFNPYIAEEREYVSKFVSMPKELEAFFADATQKRLA